MMALVTVLIRMILHTDSCKRQITCGSQMKGYSSEARHHYSTKKNKTSTEIQRMKARKIWYIESTTL